MHEAMSSIALTRQATYPERVQQRRCGNCGKVVSRSAYACRRCGKTQRIRPRTLVLGLSGGLLMVGMFAVATGGVLGPQAHPSGAAAALAPVVPRALPAPPASRTPEISATDLWMTYSRDPADADRRYRDRSLVVTGMLSSIGRDFGGGVVLRLGTGDAFSAVSATLATRNEPALAGLARGQVVSLICVGRGAIMGAPLLAGCFLR